MTDSDIAKRLETLRINLERLAEIPQGTFAEFAGDFRNVDSALHRLQTSIQALIDLGSERSSRLGLAPPRSSREILERLEGAGHLPAGASERFGPIFAFHNRVVHLYERSTSKSSMRY